MTQQEIRNLLATKGFFNIQSGLRNFRQSLGMTGKSSVGVGLGGIDIVGYGDSIQEGYSGSDVYFDGFMHRLKVKLQERFNPSGVLGGYGFLPVAHGNTDPSSVWTRFGTTTVGVTSFFGMSGRGFQFAPGNNGVYVRLNGGNSPFLRTAADGVQVMGFRWGGTTSARWDTGVGAAPTVGSGVQSGAYNMDNGAGIVHGGARFGVGTAESFTDKITLTPGSDNYVQVAGSAAQFDAGCEGVIAYNGDFTCGIRVHDVSKHGALVGDRLVYIRDAYNVAPGQFVTWGQGLRMGGSCNAKLYVFNYISNDCGYTAGAPTTTLSTFLTQYGQAIDYALSVASKPSVLLIIPPKPSDTTLASRTTVGERWEDFRDGIYELARQRDNVALIDTWAYLGQSRAEFTQAGWFTDNVHLSNVGHTAVADLIYKALVS